ncbi:hypothetical protein RQP46_007327 [Phenoliferia psychrophenolica]
MERFGLFPQFSQAGDQKTLTIHILGPIFDYEPLAGGMAFEEILHYLPGVGDLKIFYIGPDLKSAEDDDEGLVAPEETCPKCSTARPERTRTSFIEPLLYHEYRTRYPTLPPPDLAVAFNADAQAPTWLPTLTLLMEENTPFVLTSRSAERAREDANVPANLKSLRDLRANVNFLLRFEKVLRAL